MAVNLCIGSSIDQATRRLLTMLHWLVLISSGALEIGRAHV